MGFDDSTMLRWLGPQTEMYVCHVHADIGASGEPTINSTRTPAGFNITLTSAGIYALVFPKCKFISVIGDVRTDDITDVADTRKVNVAKDIDATTGTVAFHTASVGAADDALEPISGSEIIFHVQIGF
jgi:hypothetical protein